jgi:probable F420-dependent oxidoreductase
MAHDRRFRFGIQLSRAASAAEWAEQARRAEGLGYSTLMMPDHFTDQFAPGPALVAAANATTDLRIGTLVLDNDYKHPVVTAKEMATLDLLSDGRLELGIGAGWMASDYEQSGIPLEPAGLRVDRLTEAITVLKGLFAPGPFSFAGTHYTVTEMDGQPLPAQRPHPPFLLGGGAPRMLRLAAREADIVGVNPALRTGRADSVAARDGVAAATDQKVRWVREAAGDRYRDIELNMLVLATVITDDRAGTLAAFAEPFGLTPEELGEFPHALIGTTDQVVEDLVARRERWDVSYVVAQGADTMEALAPVVARLAGT